MTDKNTGGPAFPCEWVKVRATPGMTLRDYFAVKAMQGLIQTPMSRWPDLEGMSISQCAYEMADQMLQARGQ